MVSVTVLLAALASAPVAAQTAAGAEVTAGVNAPVIDGPAAPVAALSLHADRQLGSTVFVSGVLSGELRGADPAGAVSFRDLGTRLTLGLRAADWSEDDRVTLTVLPLDTRRIRPTHEYLLGWGYQPELQTPNGQLVFAPSPTLVLAIERQSWSAWFAGRVQFDQAPTPSLGTAIAQHYAALAGFTLEASSRVQVEARIAYHQRDEPLNSVSSSAIAGDLGASARVLIHGAELIGPPLDLTTWAAAPGRYDRLLAPVPLPEAGRAWSLAVETGTAMELLRDRLAIGGSGRVTPFFDAQLRVRLGALRLFATARCRPGELLLLDNPTLFNGLTTIRLSAAATAPPRPELGGWLGADFGFHSGLRPGLMFRVVQPAMLSVNAATPLGLGPQDVILFSGESVAIVAPSATVTPTLGAKATLRYDALEALTLVAEVDLESGARLRPEPLFTVNSATTDLHLAVWLLGQARF